MKFQIISSGVVCPGGFCSDALRSSWLPTLVTEAAGNRQYEVFLVDRDAPQLRRWETEPRMRRASPVSYYVLEAASQALERVPNLDRERTGVVGAFFLGCFVYSVRFYRQLTREGRRIASPVIFPETVFNSPLSHVVSTLRLGGPVYSQIGDTSCWSSALRTAQTWLARGIADHVLVVGAEEFEPHQLDAFRAGGLFRKAMRIGEGAGAILLAREEARSTVALREVQHGFSFVSADEALSAVQSCLDAVPSYYAVLDTASGWMAPLVSSLVGNRRTLPGASGCVIEAATASCAWNTALAVELIAAGTANDIAVPFWGLSQECGIACCGR